MYGDLSAFENLALHARLRGLEPVGSWQSASAMFAIDPLRDRRVRELSRGQRQRVALARTMLGKPEVLLLDEPSTGLDSSAVERLVQHLREVSGAGTLVLTVTHDPALASALDADRWVMKDGRLVSRETI
jgi:ABC-type multidrug transport system ATPase subunit